MADSSDRSWSQADIEIDLQRDGTDDPVVTFDVRTPAGALVCMAEPVLSGRSLRLAGFHMHAAADVTANSLGPGRLRQAALAFMEMFDVDELAIEGAVRTTGAHPGRRPRPVRFRRPAGAAP